jgi:hypothetical protein
LNTTIDRRGVQTDRHVSLAQTDRHAQKVTVIHRRLLLPLTTLNTTGAYRVTWTREEEEEDS